MNDETEPTPIEDDNLEALPESVDAIIDAESDESLLESYVDADANDIESETSIDDDIMDIIDDSDDMMGDALDIDAALASVGTLEEELAEREAQEQAEREYIEAQRQAEAEEAQRRASHYFPRPPLLSLKRGEMASVIPALVLMAFGAWLTMTLTTNDGKLNESLTLVLGMASIGLILVTQWMTSERWSRGTGFLGLTLLLSSGLMVFLANDAQLGYEGYPLVIVILGLSMLLIQFLSQPIGINLTFIGIALIVAGMIGLIVSTGIIEGQEWKDIAQVAWIPVLIIVLFMIGIPLVLNRRGRE